MNIDTSPLTRFLSWLGTPMRWVGTLFARVLPFWILGCVAIALVIWFGGPLLAVADYRPLESETARIVFIAVLVGLYVLYRVIRWWRAKSLNAGLFSALSKGNAKDLGADATPNAAAAGTKNAPPSAVRSNIQNAVELLRTTQFGAQPSLAARITGIGSKRYIYQMPWYMFVGAPGAGKTTALLNSGLKFPLAEKLGQDPLRGVAGTRHCDWWITDQAVMIDTAGRYTTQDSDRDADSAEWQEFLSLLRKFRPRQPVNGIIVTVSVADLLMLAPNDRERQAANVNARLQELVTQLGHEFPVYVMVTKADLLAGFTEFFELLDRSEREQVWGFTLPFEPANRAGTTAATVTTQLDLLSNRLVQLTFDRLHQERDLNSRALVYGFPYQFQSLREPLAEFVERAFGATKLAAAPMVRGIYFASGTQEGNPIDRIIGALARGFGLQRQMLAPLRPSGRAYFLKQWLHEVVFPEAVLAGTNLRWEKRARLLKWSVAVGSVALAIFGLSGLTASFFTNRSYVAEVRDKTARLADQIREGETERTEIKTLLPIYAALLALPRTATVEPARPGFWQGFGLFQGTKLTAAAEQSYHRMLRDTFAPQIAARMAQVLRKGGTTPELQYETLKAYLMLHYPDRMDADAFKGWVSFDIETSLGASLSPEERAAVLQHVEALLSRNVLQSSLGFDEKLVNDVRATQLSVPFPQRVHERLKRQGVSTEINDFRITAAGGPSAALVFARAGGRSLNDGVPALYTYDGYYKGFTKALDDSIRQLADEEVWVLGVKDSENAKRVKEAKGRESLVNEVKRLYLVEYGDIWEKFIADISVAKSASLSQTLQTVRLLSSTDSPLVRVMRAIAREVTLADRVDLVGGAVNRATEAATEVKQKLMGMLGGKPAVPSLGAPVGNAPIELLVDDRFIELRNLVRAPAQGQPAPIDAQVALMGELYNYLVAADSAVKTGAAPPPGEVLDRVAAAAGRAPEPLKGILGTLRSTGAGQAMGATKANLSQNMKIAVTDFCVKAIGNRYPFVRSSGRDVTPEDFARLFGPSGVLDEFFQKQLAQYVDVGTKPWRYRRLGDGQNVEGGAALVEFQRAAEIRNVFFGGGARAATTRIDIKPIDMDPALEDFQLDADGQLVSMERGRPGVPRSIQWPGPKGTTQVKLQVEPGGAPLVFEGAWALHRMFDRATIEPMGGPDKFRATFQFDGKSVRLEVTASSVQNPFRLNELQAFRCPAAL